MVEVGLDLDAVGLTVDEGRHACSGKAHTVVVKILAVNALDAFAAVLVAIGSHVRFERTVSALLRVGLVGPVETVHGGHRRRGVRPVPRAALPGTIQGVKTAVGQMVSVPVAVVAPPRSIAHDV